MPLADVDALTFGQLRDLVLEVAPLDTAHVKRVNAAEAAFWSRSQGDRTAWSDGVLGFECGGQQWVFEVALPCGTVTSPSGADIHFVEEVLREVETRGLPAPCPIEQRWSARSMSPLSPAHDSDPDALFSWVGVIMYLPLEDRDDLRRRITGAFDGYRDIVEGIGRRYCAHPHWAKI